MNTKKSSARKYFRAHPCNLSKDKLDSYDIQCGFLRKFFLDIMTVRPSDIRAKNMYKSYATLCAEKYRQYKYYPLSIHPFSSLRIWIETYCVFIIFISNTMASVHSSKKYLSIQRPHMKVDVVFDFLYLLKIIANFFTGYVEGNTYQYVVLDLKKISFKYMTSWFIIDVATTLGLVPMTIDFGQCHSHLLILAIKLLRLPSLMLYMNNLMTVMKLETHTRTLVNIFVLITSYITWNIFFQFTTEYIVEGTHEPASPRKCSWLTIGKLWNATEDSRYIYALDRAVGMLRRNANMNFVDYEQCFEIYFMIFWFISRILIYHTTLIYIVSLFGLESAQAKYYILTKQVENYMNHRKFPPRIKKKILEFYAIRFQSTYNAEDKMLSCVSGQLREDMIMHTGRQLVREIQFLKQLPRSLLLQICFQLKIVVFIAGDIIIKINTIGECMYFIDKGTVAIYSESGNEVTHLEDEDFFGASALVMKHRFHTASAVAVTNCELFRLEKEDFDTSIACYPTVYEAIKKVAINRLEQEYVMDEHHKAEMRMGGDYDKRNVNESVFGFNK